jgi:hypothetical protein
MWLRQDFWLQNNKWDCSLHVGHIQTCVIFICEACSSLAYSLLNASFLLQLEHYSISMPIAGQCFPFWTKRMYISWDNTVTFVPERLKGKLYGNNPHTEVDLEKHSISSAEL